MLAECLLRQLGEERVSHLIGPAPLMTSLDMHGFSVTLVASEPELIEALTAPTRRWPGRLFRWCATLSHSSRTRHKATLPCSRMPRRMPSRRRYCGG